MKSTKQSRNAAADKLPSKEIDLLELYKVIKRRIWLIIILTALITLIGGLYSKMTYHPVYQASSRVLVKATPDLMNTLLVLMDEPIVLGKVVEELHLAESPEQLANKVSVGSVNQSQIVTITVLDSDPIRAAKIANATAEAYKSEIPKLVDFNNFNIILKANENKFYIPINENFMRNVVVAFILGLLLSVGLVFLINSLDNTVKSEKEIENLLDIPVLGSVSRVSKRRQLKKMNKQKSVALRGESIGS